VKAPGGYVELELDDRRVWVWGEAAGWARSALSAAGTLHDWAAEQPGARTMEGRGLVWDVPAPVPGPDGRERWAVRHYKRGGAVAAPVLDDRYLAVDTPRPLRELRCSEVVRARGIPTPAVVAGAVYPAGIFYKADLVTEVVPRAVDLRELLFGEGADGGTAGGGAETGGHGGGADPARALEAAGRLIRRMEHAGVYHPDLNAGNLLVTGSDPVEVHLLDLDRCQARDQGTPAPVGPMADRLRRSLRKLAGRADAPLPDQLRAALERGLSGEG